MTIQIDKLSGEIATALTEYTEEVQREVNNNSKKIADNVCKSLKADTNIPIKSGNYRKSFYVKAVRSETDVRYVIANKKYRLTHLLENGHITSSGKRTRAFPHWKKAEQQANLLVETMINNLGDY